MSKDRKPTKAQVFTLYAAVAAQAAQVYADAQVWWKVAVAGYGAGGGLAFVQAAAA